MDRPRRVEDVDAPRFEDEGLRVIEEVSGGRARGAAVVVAVEALGTLCPGREGAAEAEVEVDLAATTGFFIV